MENKSYDVVIVGAGPAGMFAAYELVEKNPKLSILIIDEGKDINQRKCPMEQTIYCTNCKPCDIMCGVGGSGTFSDGTLNLRPDIGGDLSQFTGDSKSAWDLVDYVDRIYLKFGAPAELQGNNENEVYDLKRKSAEAGIKFIEIKQRHMGSDKSPEVIKNFANYLRSKGVEFLLKTKVNDIIIENETCTGVKIAGKGNGEGNEGNEDCGIYGRFILLAPGRVGAQWCDDTVQKHKIKAKFGPIDVGVRVEVPAIIMDPVIRVNRDPKFHIWTTEYGDFVRTFCTNHRGFVVKEKYDGFIGVNGHSMKTRESENTNFAFLVRIELTHPVEDTIKYGRSIAKLATTMGGGNPIIQRLGDLRRGRRSTEARLKRSIIENTLTDVTPGNIAMALPHKILTDVLEGLKKLNEVIPGVASDSTFLYAPEVKFYSMHLEVTQNMETSIKNLFAAGDGTGLSRDIINASATGVLAARGIINKL